MPHKYNRNRNTFSVSRDDYFSKQGLERQFQTSTQSLKCFSNYEKTFISLKLLEKCSQKMFNINEQFYDSLIKHQNDCNNILSSTTIDTRKELEKDQNEDNYLSQFQGIKESNLKKIRKNSNEDQLISSWTAFENLDITYKTKERELTNQNIQLRKNIQKIQRKLKSLYDPPQNEKLSIENQQHLYQSTFSNFQQSSLAKIQSRLLQHRNLIMKMKSKIEKKKNQQEEYKEVYTKLLKICRQKYGEKSTQKIKQMFQKSIQQSSIL